MRDLFAAMTGREIEELIGVFSQHGITMSDLRFLKDSSDHWGPVVAAAIKEGARNWADAVGADLVKATEALSKIDHSLTLEEIYPQTPLPAVRIKIMNLLTSRNAIYRLIQNFDGPERRDAQLIGLKKLLSEGSEAMDVLELMDNKSRPPLRETHAELYAEAQALLDRERPGPVEAFPFPGPGVANS